MAKNSTALSQLFAAFLISIAIYRVIGNMYRSECRRDALLVATDRDKVLSQNVGGVLQTITNTTLPICAKQCSGHNQCLSLNFKKAATSECEILGFNKTTAGAVIENKPGWIHYEPINQVTLFSTHPFPFRLPMGKTRIIKRVTFIFSYFKSALEYNIFCFLYPVFFGIDCTVLYFTDSLLDRPKMPPRGL